MKKISHIAVSLAILASFSTPLLAAAAGQNGDSCTGSGQGTCDSGFYCVPSDYGSLCASSPSGYAPSVSSGAGSVNTTYLRFYYDLILTIVNSYFVPILIAIAFIVFLWGTYKYFIYGAENESEKAEGRKFVMWSIIGLVIITSIWGLVNMVKDTIVPTSAKSNHPTYPTL